MYKIQQCVVCHTQDTLNSRGVCIDCLEQGLVRVNDKDTNPNNDNDVNRASFASTKNVNYREAANLNAKGTEAMNRGYTNVKDSGKRESFPTGAVRDTEEGKPRIDLFLKYVPIGAINRIATHYVNGARKYGDHNWQKGIPTSRCISSAFRHLYQYLIGDRTEDHLAAVCFNVIAILYWEETKTYSMLDTPSKCRSLEAGGFINDTN